VSYIYTAKNLNDTKTLASKIASICVPNLVIALHGDLGSGKTTFVQYLGKSLGIKEDIKSPTFAIVNEYSSELPLFHFDVYRLKDHLHDLGFNEYFFANGVCVIEWAEIIASYLPKDYIDIQIASVENNHDFTLSLVGTKYLEIYEKLIWTLH
jgi:tRNA threonylcarbamoyladenosine biosynthesis protein TsaE